MANNAQNPCNLKDTFDILGGYNFLIKGDGFLHYQEDLVKAWMKKSSMQEFTMVDLQVYVVPQLIYLNSGLPLALLAGQKKYSHLYAHPYWSMACIDWFEQINREIYNGLLSKCILFDQHVAFKKLHRDYGIQLFYCYDQIIGFLGAHSPISILVSEVLLFKWELDIEENLLRIIEVFKMMLKLHTKELWLFYFNKNGKPCLGNQRMESFYHDAKKAFQRPPTT